MKRNVENAVVANKPEVAASNSQKPVGKKVSRAKSEARVGCDNLIESVTHDHAPEEDRNNSNGIRKDNGIAPALKLGDLFDADFSVTKKHSGTPDIARHTVIIDGEPEVRSGRDGVYVAFDLCEKDTNLCWKAFVNQSELTKMLEDVNFYNNAMLAGLSGMKAILKLQKSYFDCWTLVTEKGSVATYFNENRWSKRLYAMAMNRDKVRPEAPAPKQNNEAPFDI